MHCGMCLPTCPTYAETLQERSSPRGRIAMMRAIADDRLEVSKEFAAEMYFCLGCLACQTACPAGVDYATLFEQARAEIERVGILDKPQRTIVRGLTLNRLFISKRRLHFLGRLLYLYQRSGIQAFVRRSGLLKLAPKALRELEPLTPTAQRRDTASIFKRNYKKKNPVQPRHRVALLSGCVQDIAFVDVNADTICALQANGCEVLLPAQQQCCGSLHAHNGEVSGAVDLARCNIDAFKPETLDAIIINAGGCGSHMKQYHHLLADDPEYAEKALEWSAKVKDIHEFLDTIGCRVPSVPAYPHKVTYHESCHLKHGQQVSTAPRRLLQLIPGLELVELTEADWCCGSAGIYNITQPEMSMKLLDRKMAHIGTTTAGVVATGNPGCTIQIQHGAKRQGLAIKVVHPISLLAAAYREEQEAK